ncbi:MAG: sensor histidine kinase [Planctomycetota bacterium]
MERLCLLAVDDEAGMRHSVRRALSSWEAVLPGSNGRVAYDIELASSGEDALARVEQGGVDLILLDYKMNGISGMDVLRELQKQQRDILVIMITAFATIQTAIQATRYGAFDFIAKPFTPDELKQTIAKATVHLLTERRARDLEKERRRVRFEFIRVLGHELKAPLSVIESYLEVMSSQALGPEIETYSEIIRRCQARSEGMRKLIADLLDMTRLESGQKKRELNDIDIMEAARSVQEAQSIGAADRNITISLNGPDMLMMTADRSEIEIVLNNLVSNAVKYNHDGGQVSIVVDAEDDFVTLTVRDTGIGLSREEADRLFHEFTRIRNEKTKGIPGSGLGLSIVKKVADLYRGRAEVESEPGIGTTFRVHLARNLSHGPTPEAVEDRDALGRMLGPV